jgi:hypothetical protein
MSRVGFEPKIPVFEGAKTVHALDSAATVIGTLARLTFLKLDISVLAYGIATCRHQK